MLRNYLEVAFRHLGRHKLFSAINLLGLTLGMTACLLIGRYVQFELSYDRFHQKADRIYRIRNDRYQGGKLVQQGAITYPMVPLAMKREFPEVESVVRIAPWIADHTVFHYRGNVFREKKLLFAEGDFFTVFSFPLLQGDPATALREPSTMVLSESKARQYFGKENPVGKTILFEGFKPFTVTGVFRDFPPNSHLQMDLLVSYVTLAQWMDGYKDSWTFAEEVYAYVLLAEGASPEKANGKLRGLERYYRGGKRTGTEQVFSLQPLTDIHLYSHLQFELGPNGNAVATWGLAGVGLLILLIATANYLNLSTVRYLERVREVGVRKALGASKGQLRTQFMLESGLVTLLSFAVSLVLFAALSPVFFRWLALPPLGLNAWAGLMALTLLIGTGLLSSLYPAVMLPRLNPVAALKGKHAAPASRLPLSKLLVIGQFGIAITLVVFTIMVYRQLSFMQEQALGVNISGTMVVYGPMGIKWDNQQSPQRVESFLSEATKLAGVHKAGNSRYVPGDVMERVGDARLKGSSEGVTLAAGWVDSHFFDVYDMHLLAGRFFLPPDSNRIVLNASAARRLGFSSPEGAIGKRLTTWGGNWEGEVVGVVNDHHQQSLHHAVEPIAFMGPGHGSDGYFSLKVSAQHLPRTIGQVEALYKNLFKGASFQYLFLEEYFNQAYRQDYRLRTVLGLFTGCALFISCLGLWGVILQSVAGRTKEIGIRKVAGASVLSLVYLLTRDLLKLLLVALLLALPLAVVVLEKWLSSFAYRVPLSGWVFLLTGAGVVLIALLTVSIQVFKAAATNPVVALRNE